MAQRRAAGRAKTGSEEDSWDGTVGGAGFIMINYATLYFSCSITSTRNPLQEIQVLSSVGSLRLIGVSIPFLNMLRIEWLVVPGSGYRRPWNNLKPFFRYKSSSLTILEQSNLPPVPCRVRSADQHGGSVFSSEWPPCSTGMAQHGSKRNPRESPSERVVKGNPSAPVQSHDPTRTSR